MFSPFEERRKYPSRRYDCGPALHPIGRHADPCRAHRISARCPGRIPLGRRPLCAATLCAAPLCAAPLATISLLLAPAHAAALRATRAGAIATGSTAGLVVPRSTAAEPIVPRSTAAMVSTSAASRTVAARPVAGLVIVSTVLVVPVVPGSPVGTIAPAGPVAVPAIVMPVAIPVMSIAIPAMPVAIMTPMVIVVSIVILVPIVVMISVGLFRWLVRRPDQRRRLRWRGRWRSPRWRRWVSLLPGGIFPVQPQACETATGANSAERTRKLLIAGEERQRTLVSESAQRPRVHGTGIGHTAAARGDDAIALPSQLLAPTGAAELRRTAEQHHRRRTVWTDIEVERRPADADRSSRRDDRVGRRRGIAANPAKGALGRPDGQLLGRIRVVVDIVVDDDGRTGADRQFRSVAEDELSEPAYGCLYPLIPVHRRPDDQRPPRARHFSPDQSRLAHRLGGGCRHRAAEHKTEHHGRNATKMGHRFTLNTFTLACNNMKCSISSWCSRAFFGRSRRTSRHPLTSSAVRPTSVVTNQGASP